MHNSHFLNWFEDEKTNKLIYLYKNENIVFSFNYMWGELNVMLYFWMMFKGYRISVLIFFIHALVMYY